MDDEVFKRFPANGHRDTRNLLRANLVLHFPWMIHKKSVSRGAEAKWYAFVGLLRGCSSILVPSVDMLSCGKMLLNVDEGTHTSIGKRDMRTNYHF